MPIRLNCPCGKRLQVGDDKAGDRTRCPGCKRILEVEVYREKDAYRFQDETQEEPNPKIVSRNSEDVGDEPEESDEIEEVEEVRRKPSSWVPAYCYVCDESTKCKRCLFWSALVASRETSHQGNMVITRTTYRNVQQHQLFLCRECAVEQWLKAFTLKIIVDLACIAGIILLLVVILAAARTNASIALLIMLLACCVPLGFVIFHLKKLRNPTFNRSIMEPAAIKLARREIRKHTGADTFFTSQQIKALRIR